MGQGGLPPFSQPWVRLGAHGLFAEPGLGLCGFLPPPAPSPTGCPTPLAGPPRHSGSLLVAVPGSSLKRRKNTLRQPCPVHANKAGDLGCSGGLNIPLGGCGSSGPTLPHSKPETGLRAPRCKCGCDLCPSGDRERATAPRETSPTDPRTPRGAHPFLGDPLPMEAGSPCVPQKRLPEHPSPAPRCPAAFRGAHTSGPPPGQPSFHLRGPALQSSSRDGCL